MFSISGKRRWGDFEVEPALVDDSEKLSSMIEPIPTEHRATGHATQLVQLIQPEIFETIELRGRETIQTGLRAATVRTAMGNVIWSPRWYCITALKMRRFTSCFWSGEKFAMRF